MPSWARGGYSPPKFEIKNFFVDAGHRACFGADCSFIIAISPERPWIPQNGATHNYSPRSRGARGRAQESRQRQLFFSNPTGELTVAKTVIGLIDTTEEMHLVVQDLMIMGFARERVGLMRSASKKAA